MRSLLDVNVLIALLDANHSLHNRAADWFSANAHAGWASCPLTQNGCMRVMSHPAYPNVAPVQAVAERLAMACAHDLHEFWADDLSLLDGKIASPSRIHGPGQITDLYLLALVVRHGARLATFDKSIVLDAIKGAERKHLLVL